jgi:hypothetical protein
MKIRTFFQRLVLPVVACAPLAASADYVGTLKLPGAAPSSPLGFYSFAATSPTNLAPLPAGDGYRLKLGYKYSRYLAVESEYVEFGNNAGSIFANPASLAGGFRTTGIGVDTIATLPVWRQFSFYGRLGAYSGSRNIFSSNPVSLLGDNTRTRVRYGLGIRYDFTKALGVRAEVERYSPFGTPFAGEPESDTFSVGVSWRF